MLTALAFKLDSLGFRPFVAKTASLVYPDQSFSVDASGNWVNKQDGCTIVSPTIHTSTYAALREWGAAPLGLLLHSKAR